VCGCQDLLPINPHGGDTDDDDDEGDDDDEVVEGRIVGRRRTPR
jgi:hypothetical protein